jgi:hypothetical protein
MPAFGDVATAIWIRCAHQAGKTIQPAFWNQHGRLPFAHLTYTSPAGEIEWALASAKRPSLGCWLEATSRDEAGDGKRASRSEDREFGAPQAASGIDDRPISATGKCWV